MFEMLLSNNFANKEIGKMEFENRKKDILDILYEKEKVSVAELSRVLFVSEMTIRRDLKELEESGVLKRYRGGAVLTVMSRELPASKRFFLDEEDKKELGKQASRHLKDNISIFIDSSSTCQYVIPYVKNFENITVITNSINALLAATKNDIKCILIGGEYYGKDECFVGSLTERFAEEFNVDVAFISSLGISEDGIISDTDLYQTMVRKSIIKHASKKVLLFEKNKQGKKYLYTLCKNEDADEVIISS